MSNSQNLSLKSNISSVKGIGPKKTNSFNKLGIVNIEDGLKYYPRAYQDLRNPSNIKDIQDGEKKLINAKVILKQFGRGYGRKRTLHLLIEDNTGRADVIFFMAGYFANNFEIGESYHFFGKAKVENKRVTIFHPEYSKIDEESEGILPVYSLTAGLNQKDLRHLTGVACGLSDELTETLPSDIIKNSNLCDLSSAYKNIHYPESEDKYKEARYRLVYEELFDLKIALSLSSRKKTSDNGIVINSNTAESFIRELPFKLTNAQQKVINEVLVDMRSKKSMNRLIQGDVGSGKTIIAEAAIFEAVNSGFQALFMAPTEILAIQHYKNLKKDFDKYDIKTSLLVSSLSAKEKKQVLEDICSGKSDVIIGTHALIQEAVKYKNVGLVITDEQHRFGVNQRKKLSEKGDNPDILIMTATPIPRTLAVTIYADLDVSIIDELPPGRKEIKTIKFNENERKDAYKILLDEISKGRQAYIVAPFIEDSDTIDARSATRLYEAFIKKHPDISCALLHGDMDDYEKQKIMTAFANNEISLLISTVVIEVGIDVPNASVMLIENAERFGLAQLHQLRGRVGRGEYESYCLICMQDNTDIAKQRADILCKTSDGFIIAEKDLEIRGPGEFFGYKQHGLPQLVLADPIKHKDILDKASKDAEKLLSEDPNLENKDHSVLIDIVNEKFILIDNITI